MRASVVIASYERSDRIGACLEAIAAQGLDGVEAIVVDSSPDEHTARIAAGFAGVRVIRSTRRLLPHEARNRGAAEARGEVIVFTDADCVALPGWIERLLAAHDAGHEIVGGGIDPGRGGPVETAANLCKFALWLEGLAPGARRTLPTANVSLTREAWERVGPFRLGGWSGDTELAWRAREAGIPLRFEPAAAVVHRDPVGAREFIAERRDRGRAFAALRIDTRVWGRLRAAGYAAASPVIAAWLSARGFALAVRSGRPGAALRSLPLLFAGFAAWTSGEATAYADHAAGRLRR